MKQQQHIFYFLFFIFYFLFNFAYTQVNLVPNPSFEDTVMCPITAGQLNYALNWINPTQSTPDYYNNCNTDNFSTPANIFGFEVPKTGNAYAGLGVFSILPGISDSFREYIEVQLTDSLKKNETYCLAFYVSLADSLSKYAISCIGAFFSNDMVLNATKDPLPNIPQIVNSSSNILLNNVGWIKTSGQIKSIGGERWLTIGNFNNNFLTDTTYIRTPASKYSQNESYYYIDDVSVVHLDADAGANKTICAGDSVQLGRSTQSYISYKWRANATLSDSTAAQPYAKPTATTTYYLTATLTGSGCEKIDSVTVYVSNVSASITADTLLCPGTRGTATVTISNGSAPYTYSWSTGTTGTATDSLSVTGLAIGNYSVNIMDSFGCSVTTSVTFTNSPTPLASVSSTQTDISTGDEITLTGSGGTSYLWQPAQTLSCATCQSTTAKPTATTVYTLTITDANNCIDTAQIKINFRSVCLSETDVFIPNIFSPNADGKNDILKIEGSGLTDIYFAIYNRWGNLVYETYDQARGWDGTQRGNPCEAGTYVYYLRATCSKTNSTVNLKGNVSLIK